MSLTKGGLTKTKTKTFAAAAGSFPANAWQYDMEYCIEMPRFFESAVWRKLVDGQPIPPPPGPDETALELQELMRKQNDRAERGFARPISRRRTRPTTRCL